MKKNNQKEEKDYRKSDEKATFKKINEIFIRFSSALRTAQIFESNNLTFIKHIYVVFTLIQNVLKDEKEVVFEFKEDTLFFNTIRVKFHFLSYHYFKLLSSEFRKKK